MPNWKMIKEFGKAVGKRIGEPNKTSKMIEHVAGDSDEFLEGKRHGQFLKGKATDAAYQSMYDKLDDNARAIFDAYSFDMERAYGPDDAYRIAVKESGVDPDMVPGSLEDWQDRFGFDLTDTRPRNVDISNRVDKLASKESDNALDNEFDKALDEAAENHGYKKWREESKDMPLNDGFGGDLHDVNREDAVQRSREKIIKALQQNTDRDVTDVLRDFGYIFEE